MSESSIPKRHICIKHSDFKQFTFNICQIGTASQPVPPLTAELHPHFFFISDMPDS